MTFSLNAGQEKSIDFGGDMNPDADTGFYNMELSVWSVR